MAEFVPVLHPRVDRIEVIPSPVPANSIFSLRAYVSEIVEMTYLADFACGDIACGDEGE